MPGWKCSSMIPVEVVLSTYEKLGGIEGVLSMLVQTLIGRITMCLVFGFPSYSHSQRISLAI